MSFPKKIVSIVTVTVYTADVAGKTAAARLFLQQL